MHEYVYKFYTRRRRHFSYNIVIPEKLGLGLGFFKNANGDVISWPIVCVHNKVRNKVNAHDKSQRLQV